MSKGTEISVSMEWLDLKRLTGYAAVSERTLRSWIHSTVDPLPAVRVGSKILVKRRSFDAWLEGHRVKQVDLGGMLDEIAEAVTSGR